LVSCNGVNCAIELYQYSMLLMVSCSKTFITEAFVKLTVIGDYLCLLVVMVILYIVIIMYGDSVDNTVDENSGVFSPIRMRSLPSARVCGQKNSAPTKSSRS